MTSLTAGGSSTRASLAAVGWSKSSWYRHLTPPVVTAPPIAHADRVQPHALTAAERATIIGWLAAEDYAHLSVKQTFYRTVAAGE